MSGDDTIGDGIGNRSTTRRGALAKIGTAAGALVATSGLASASNGDDVEILIDPDPPEVGTETTFTSTVGFHDHSWVVVGPNGFEQGTGRTISVTFEEAGEYTVYLTVDFPDDSAYVTTSGQIIDPDDVEPTAEIEYSPQDPVYNPVTFDGSGSSTPAGEIESYDWHFRNVSRNPDWGVFESGPNMSGETAEESFALGSTFEVGLEVTNSAGNTGRTTVEFTPEENPNTPYAEVLVDGSENELLPSNPVTLDASESTSPNGSIEEYNWELYNYETEETRYETGKVIEVTLESEVRYRATLTVIDETGKEDTESTSSFWPDADYVPE